MIRKTPQAVSIPVKEMTMNRLDFDELVIGGNLKKNLKIESNFNQTLKREKIKYSFVNGPRELPNDTIP